MTFLSLVKLQLGGGACFPPLAYTYAPFEENKKGVRKFSARFLTFSNEISTVQKIVLSSSRGQGNFRGLEASRPRPRTSKCVLEDVLEAKDVLEDSTSVIYISVFSLNSRTGNDAVELIVKKNLLLWLSFSVMEVTFYSLI